jgi:hypothetical protein
MGVPASPFGGALVCSMSVTVTMSSSIRLCGPRPLAAIARPHRGGVLRAWAHGRTRHGRGPPDRVRPPACRQRPPAAGPTSCHPTICRPEPRLATRRSAGRTRGPHRRGPARAGRHGERRGRYWRVAAGLRRPTSDHAGLPTVGRHRVGRRVDGVKRRHADITAGVWALMRLLTRGRLLLRTPQAVHYGAARPGVLPPRLSPCRGPGIARSEARIGALRDSHQVDCVGRQSGARDLARLIARSRGRVVRGTSEGTGWRGGVARWWGVVKATRPGGRRARGERWGAR